MALFSLCARNVLLSVGWIAFVLWVKDRRTPKPSRDGEPLRKPPKSLPILGNGIVFLQPRQRLFAWFTHCEHLFGHETLSISIPSLPPGVIISSPRNLDFIFRNEGILFQKGEFLRSRSWDLFGRGIINVDGTLWRLQRRAGVRFLSAGALEMMAGRRVPAYLDEAAGLLRGKAKSGEPVDMQDVMLEITTRVMGRMAYNMDMHADEAFTLAFEHASGVTAARVQNPLWFLTEFFTQGSKLSRSIATIKDYGRRIVASAVADRAAHGGEAQKKSDAPGNLIQALLDSIGDEEVVADAALNYLSAGRDTVAQSLSWTLYFLMRHPHITAKLRHSIQELRDSSSADEPSSGEGTSIQDAALFTPTKLPFALAIFYESLRLRPPIPFELKQVAQPTTLPDGTFLPAGTIVVWCIWAMGRSRVTWGPDAETFRPERWLISDNTVTQRPPAEFPVFNGGPRACLGKRMAELIAVQTLAGLLSEFDFEPAYEGGRVSKSSLTLPMEGGLPVYVRSRAAATE